MGSSEPPGPIAISFGSRMSIPIMRAHSRAREAAVVNFPPKQIGPFVSEVLILGAYDARDQVILLRPDVEVSPGAKIG